MNSDFNRNLKSVITRYKNSKKNNPWMLSFDCFNKFQFHRKNDPEGGFHLCLDGNHSVPLIDVALVGLIITTVLMIRELAFLFRRR